MQQYFIDVSDRDVNELVISGKDAHHIIKVMRMRVGERVRVVLNQEVAVFYTIIQLNEKEQTVYLQKEAIEHVTRELPVEVTIVLGLLKSDKFDYAVQKLTELGVQTIIPWQAARSIVKTNAQNEGKKRQRWQAIAKEAAEQSKRLHIPIIEAVQDLANILDKRTRTEEIYVAYEELVGQIQPQKLNFYGDAKKVTFIIGPEGGIAPDEVALLTQMQQQRSIHFITLGHRILRAETAAIFAMSLVAANTEHLI